jgi:hypothetical protein
VGDEGVGGDVGVSGLAFAPIRSLLDASYKTKQPANTSEVWCLNLDQVESHSGKVLSKLMMKASEVGSSTHAFANGTVLYSKLRPYLNKVVVADSDGVATTELDFTRFCRQTSTSNLKLFKCQRTQQVKMTVPSDSIIKTLDVIKHV